MTRGDEMEEIIQRAILVGVDLNNDKNSCNLNNVIINDTKIRDIEFNDCEFINVTINT